LNFSQAHQIYTDRVYTDHDIANYPSHLAIIMDGNGRWAKQRILNRIKGHEKGAETVRTIVENWQRPKVEVAALMALLANFLKSEQKNMLDNNIRLNAIGQIERLPENVQNALHKAMVLTEENNGMLLNLALSYGARAEIVRMVKDIAIKVREGIIDPDSITDDVISDRLYTKGMSDPDLLIRTGGEMRISNFLLWQIAYTEIYVTDTLWPDFSKDEFIKILENCQHRKRRFGKV
jgi:undecaprenyl diphosphate synthase